MAKKQWRKGEKGFLFNKKALAKVWRARVFEGIQKHTDLSLSHLKKMPDNWVVDCTKVGHGLPALKYLSRYLYRGVLPDKDITYYDQDKVIFRYTDSTTKQITHRTLPPLKFLMLILQHVLPKGLQRVRDYGLLSSSAKQLRLVIQLLLLPVRDWLTPTKEPRKYVPFAYVLAVNMTCSVLALHESLSRKANIKRIMIRMMNNVGGQSNTR
jgi:hypothetical protein